MIESQVFLKSIAIFGLLAISAARGQDQKAAIDSVNSIRYDYIISHLHKSISIFSENAQRAKKSGYTIGEGQALSQLGMVNYLRGNFDKSSECYVQAFRIFERINDYNDLAAAYGEYGYQLKRRDLQKAIGYMRVAIDLTEEKNLDEGLKCKLLDNYGVLKEMQGDLDSAIILYKKALSIKKRRSDSIGIPYSLNNIAGVKVMQKKFREAYHYIQQSDQYRSKEVGDFGRTENLSLWGDILMSEGKVDSAIQKYSACLKLANALGYPYLQQYSYLQLSEAYKLKGNFAKALEYYRSYTTSKDSLLNQQNQAKIAELEIDYETAQKNKLLASREFELKQKTLLLIMAVGAIVFLLIMSAWIYKYQVQKRKRVREELELQGRLKEAELGNKISAEKLRISRELHDNIGSRLTFVISSIDNMTFSQKPTIISSKLKNLSNFSRETLDDLRNTIWAMKNEDGCVGQLTLKINGLIQKLTTNGVHIDFNVEQNVPDTIHLSSVQMLNLFRIVQEAIQNCIKHSHAEKVSICFNEFEKGFSLSVQDNGRGFNSYEVNSGNGIANMRSRCEEASGDFQLQSGPDGTTVKCSFSEYKANAVLSTVGQAAKFDSDKKR
jgi:signal transduction histidine kinase